MTAARVHSAVRRLPVGTPVAFYPGGNYRPEAHWHGVVAVHSEPEAGLVDVECTDPHGFMNNRVGQLTTVDARLLRKDAAADAQLTFGDQDD